VASQLQANPVENPSRKQVERNIVTSIRVRIPFLEVPYSVLEL
jgi:hypothetical protein